MKQTFPGSTKKVDFDSQPDDSLQREYSVSKGEKMQEVNYTRFMIGTYLDPVDGWMLGYAPFDPVTRTVGEFQSERVAGDSEVMRERLAIKQINLGLYSSEPTKEEKKEDIY